MHPEGQVLFDLNIYKSSASLFVFVLHPQTNAPSSLLMKPRVCTQSTEGHRTQSGGIFTSPFASIARQDLREQRGRRKEVLIIQEELEATLTALHIQLVTVERLRGKTEPWGRSGCERPNKAENDISKTGALCRHHSVVSLNGMLENCKNTEHIFFAFKTSVV